MIETIILTLVIGFILFELIEHVAFPLFWFFMGRKRKSICEVSGMLGKVGEVKHWKKNEGKVFVNGELWKAASEAPLLTGDRVVIQNVEGLTLQVNPWKRLGVHNYI
ncbi:MAG: NfeD family protein [Acidimicrobiia bacterium]